VSLRPGPSLSARVTTSLCDLTQAAGEILDRGGTDMGAWSVAQRGFRVFSHFRYSRRCDAETRIEPIEPLVGLLRHPFAVPGCLPQVLTAVQTSCARKSTAVKHCSVTTVAGRMSAQLQRDSMVTVQQPEATSALAGPCRHGG